MIDTHCHLTRDYHEGGYKEVLERAHAQGVRALVAIGVTLENSKEVCSIAACEDRVYGTVGVHPLSVKEEGIPSCEDLLRLASPDKIIGLGETGLDLTCGTPEALPSQRESFLRHVHVAHALNKTVIIHTRGAWAETESVLEEASERYPGCRYILHYFAGDLEIAQRFIERFGCFVSFSGVVTFHKKSDAVREAARGIPVERILCETDTPYTAPEPYRGKKNEPAWVQYVYATIADLRGMDVETLIKQVQSNVEQVFGRAL